jgi:hypothetical protein
MWRHHLANAANRGVITDRKQRQRAARAADEAARQHDLSVGRHLMAEQERIATQTQEDRAVELERAAEGYTNRGDAATAATCRTAAGVVRHMTAQEFAEHVQARLRHDPAAAAHALARRADAQ